MSGHLWLLTALGAWPEQHPPHQAARLPAAETPPPEPGARGPLYLSPGREALASVATPSALRHLMQG